MRTVLLVLLGVAVGAGLVIYLLVHLLGAIF